jgi:transposase
LARTSLSPNSDKMSKHTIAAGDASKLLALLTRLCGRAEQLVGGSLSIAVIQEAGLDGFWVHRSLEANDIESHVVDPASIAVSRRRRRAKTDGIDGETLLRTLLAWKRGEPRVCEMVVPPTPEQEDSRRLSRERAILLRERVQHVNRIKGLLAGQGITSYDPLHKDRRTRLDGLTTGDGRPLPGRLKAELLRELARIELLLLQIADVETILGFLKANLKRADRETFLRVVALVLLQVFSHVRRKRGLVLPKHARELLLSFVVFLFHHHIDLEFRR